MKLLDDGSGPALFAGGGFMTAGGAFAPYVAKWDGARWSAFGTWLGGAVFSLASFDDSSGPALYVGGSFPEHVLKWTGSSWQPLGASPNGIVLDMIAFDDGTGPALYATGPFDQIGTTAVHGIAKWDGHAWSPLGTGLSSLPSSSQGVALAVFDDGGGPALYVGGHFATAGGVTANHVAKWNGSTWSSLGTGMSGGVFDTTVSALIPLPQPAGSPPKLVAAGEFTSAGGVSAARVAVWDGSAWSPMSAGFDGYVDALASFDDGSGRALYAGGGFLHSGAASCKGVARWTGAGWTGLSSGVDNGYVTALAGLEVGPRELFAGGDFRSIGGAEAADVAVWRGAGWHPLSRGLGLDGNVLALATFDDGGGPDLYVGGGFHEAGAVSANTMARWDGTRWSDVGGGTNGYVAALTVFDDGTGPGLYAAGSFLTAGGSSASSVARWDGASWSPLGSGVGTSVDALAVYDDGSGAALYAGGYLSIAGGVSVNNIARWDGAAWSSLGAGTSHRVRALAVFDDGNGPALYAGGHFTSAGGAAASYVARWDGSTWTALGAGTNDAVLALFVFDDGTGPALYAGGDFTAAGGATAYHVARWNGAAWSHVGSGLTGFGSPTVQTFAAYDDGTGVGSALFAAGQFSSAGGASVGSIARWDGSSWTGLGLGLSLPPSGVSPTACALGVFDDGSGRKPSLFAGGNFVAAAPISSYGIAEWRGCEAVGALECFGDGSGTACPCGNSSAPGSRTGCASSILSGGALRDAGIASLAHDSLSLLGSGMPHTTELFLQGTSSVNGGAGVVNGDGLLCVGGSLVRLAVRSRTNGSSSYPAQGEPPVSTAGAVVAPGTRTYQIVYRDPASSCGSTFNATNGLRITWTP